MKSFNEWLDKKLKTITIDCRDEDNSLENLLNHIKKSGNMGHSFAIVTDPDETDEKTFHWDGDGPDYIKDIKVSEKKAK